MRARCSTCAVQAAAHARGARAPGDRAQLDVAQNERAGPSCPRSRASTWWRARGRARRCSAHPTLKDADGKPLPVLAVGDAGKGRVLALTSDDSWRWGFAGGRATSAGAPFSASGSGDPLADPRSGAHLPAHRDRSAGVRARAEGAGRPCARSAPTISRSRGAKLDVSVARIPTVLDVASTARPEPVAAQHRRHRRGRRAARSSCRRRRRAAIASPRARRSPAAPSRRTKCSWCAAPAASSRSRRRATICCARSRRRSGGSFRGPGESLDGLTLLAAARGARQPAPRRRAVEPLVDAGRRRRLPRAQLGAAPSLGLRVARNKPERGAGVLC